MNNLARYTFYGTSGAADDGADYGGGYDSRPAGGGAPMGVSIGPAGSAAGPSGAGNRVLITLNSEDRDETAYPDAADCTLILPDTLEGVTSVSLVSAEIPATEYNVVGPRLFFAEYHYPYWYPSVARLSSGNYSIRDFVDGLAASLTSATPLTPESSAIRNVYTTSYSEAWGRVCVSSNQACPFTLQFRTADVTVTSARVSPDGTMVTVTYSDQESRPLSEGAGVTFAPGFGITPLACVVQAVDEASRTMDLRVVPAILGVDKTPALAEAGVDDAGYLLTPRRKTIASVWGTSAPGATLKCSATAKLTPFSGGDGNNLGDLFGFGVLRDRSSDELGSSAVAAVQPPFGNPDGTVIVTTENPHFCNRGDVVRVYGTGSLLDAVHEVKQAIDETHILIEPLLGGFFAGIPDMHIFLEGPSLPPTTFDLASAVELVSASSGVAELLVTMKDKSNYYDMTSFAGCSVRFAVDSSFYGRPFSAEWQHCTGTVGTITAGPGSSYPNRMQLFLNYPAFVVSTEGAGLTRVANADLAQFTPSGAYLPRCLISPARYDFSRRHRFVYVVLMVSDRATGNVMATNMPGKRIFAKIPLSSGRDAVTFATRKEIEGQGQPTAAINSLRDVDVAIYNPDGTPYNFQGSEWSMTLEFACKNPLMS